MAPKLVHPAASAAVSCTALLGLTLALLYVSGRPIATDDLWWRLIDGRSVREPGALDRHGRARPYFSWLLADIVLVSFGAAVVRATWRAFRGLQVLRHAALDLVHRSLAGAGVVAMLVTIRFQWLSAFPLPLHPARRAARGRMRRAPRAHGPSRVLARLLDERGIDVFFGVNFPRERYEDLSFTNAIRSHPGRVRVYQSHHHAIWLRRG